MKCEMKERVLEYLKDDRHDLEIEKHLEHCEQCQALVEGYLAKEEAISLPEAECNNCNLKEQVENYDKGTRRIVIFTIVGLILGWFSYKYYITDFLPLKIIIGIPSLVGGAVYGSIGFFTGDKNLYTNQIFQIYRGLGDYYFPCRQGNLSCKSYRR